MSELSPVGLYFANVPNRVKKINGSPLGGLPLNAPKRVKRKQNSQKGAFPLKQPLLEKSPRGNPLAQNRLGQTIFFLPLGGKITAAY